MVLGGLGGGGRIEEKVKMGFKIPGRISRGTATCNCAAYPVQENVCRPLDERG